MAPVRPDQISHGIGKVRHAMPLCWEPWDGLPFCEILNAPLQPSNPAALNSSILESTIDSWFILPTSWYYLSLITIIAIFCFLNLHGILLCWVLECINYCWFCWVTYLTGNNSTKMPPQTLSYTKAPLNHLQRTCELYWNLSWGMHCMFEANVIGFSVLNCSLLMPSKFLSYFQKIAAIKLLVCIMLQLMACAPNLIRTYLEMHPEE